MSRARRLAEIAKANEPVFSGPHWWLADPSAKPEPAPPAALPEPVPAPEPVRAAAAAPAAGTQLTIIEVHAPEALENAPQVASVSPVAAPLASGALASASAAVPAPLQPANGSKPETGPEPERNPAELAKRLGGLREKFLWLGRKSRGVHTD